MADMDFEAEGRFEDENRGYDRERSRSPRADRRGDEDARARSASPGNRDRGNDRRPPAEPRGAQQDDEEGARNPGSNLFVTGIHPDLTEEEVTRLFEKYGEVEKCNIMRDPHTRDSRGFGFVKMVTSEQADAAKEGLQGEVHQGRTLSIEKARRARPRTPTPGKYFGPPKRDDFRGPRGGGGRYGGDRYEDRRGGGYGRRDDHGYGGRSRNYGGGGDRYEDRGYGGRRDRDDYGYRGGVDRYASRDDRYGGRGDDRRGGGGGGGGGGGSGYYDREDRAPPAGGAYGGGAPADDTRGGGRSYEDRGDDRYSRR
ncbi:RNA-binding domain-containing protein [Pseudovirgaria hyperparasitica]|uniref:RNA-binding domain-containing protein n=1 Tax=Pseudovirgaria hyperparasitica TaxID=470096 RepID=A0A6A6W320_9PEZI|nr:RNA-binding domain-containing protein [Pseudovirgaria hyperparasitica]KAF2756529.1 RNA-binding domain-containing protein [Pseudovirgaria hyperparasitica]